MRMRRRVSGYLRSRCFRQQESPAGGSALGFSSVVRVPEDACPQLGSDGFNLHVLTVESTLDFELHDAVNEGVERVVLAHADVVAGVELRAALTNDNVARLSELATE